MEYTVAHLSKMAGISVRTLHYYDEIGLLVPVRIRDNGYRVYGEKELLKLQQILFFRELEFPLERIREIMGSSDFDALKVLSEQKELLITKQKRLEKLIHTITSTISTLKGGGTMSTDDTFSAFNDPTYQQHKEEVKAKWGHTDAYRQSMERVGKMTREELEQVKQEGGAITSTIAQLMKEGKSFDDALVQAEMEKFYRHLHRFYDPSYELFKGLGQMYVDDARFTAFYEKVAPGLAVYMRDAMAFFADAHMK